MRIASIDHESGTSKRYGPQDRWYHVDCFVENREQLEFTESMEPTKYVDLLILQVPSTATFPYLLTCLQLVRFIKMISQQSVLFQLT